MGVPKQWVKAQSALGREVPGNEIKSLESVSVKCRLRL